MPLLPRVLSTKQTWVSKVTSNTSGFFHNWADDIASVLWLLFGNPLNLSIISLIYNIFHIYYKYLHIMHWACIVVWPSWPWICCHWAQLNKHFSQWRTPTTVIGHVSMLTWNCGNEYKKSTYLNGSNSCSLFTWHLLLHCIDRISADLKDGRDWVILELLSVALQEMPTRNYYFVIDLTLIHRLTHHTYLECISISIS